MVISIVPARLAAESVIPSRLMGSMRQKMALFLLDASKRTAAVDKDFFSILSELRKGLATEFGGKEINIQITEGGVVNGFHFKGTQNTAIIYLHGNGDFYETSIIKPLSWIESLKETDSTFPHLLVFNPRGTGKSSGYAHPENVAMDMLAAFEYLVDQQRIDPSRIIIAGHSMGGFFGAFGAELIQSQFPDSRIHFLSDRSFSNIGSLAALKRGAAGSVRLVDFILSKAIKWMGWDRDPVAALEALKGRVCVIYHPQDPLIVPAISLHTALLQSKRAGYCHLSLQDEREGISSSAHNRAFTDSEQDQVVAEIKKMLTPSVLV